MFVTDKIVYLQMMKAGSTHTTIILQRYCGGKHEERKHSPLKDRRRYGSKLIVSSVRNPWDWYVSLWSFSCTNHGRLRFYHNNLPRSELREAIAHRDFSSALSFPLRTLTGRPDWNRLYSDPSNQANFREWLKLMLGSEGMYNGSEGYASSPVKKVVGFMTYCFLALTTEYAEWIRVGRKKRSYDQVATFAGQHTIVNRVLRVETLNEDLASLLTEAGIDVPPAEAAQWGKKNVSVCGGYSEFYDEETSWLVESRDRFIIERFGYSDKPFGRSD